MRINRNPQFSFGQIPVKDIIIDPYSRDDIPKILKALQHVHQDEERVEAILNLIASDFAATASLDTGAEGMNFWQVFVLGTLRLGLGCDYDRLAELANQHGTLRQMLGHGPFDVGVQYKIRTIGENLSRLRDETLKRPSTG
jgi:IS5 family transposase